MGKRIPLGKENFTILTYFVEFLWQEGHTAHADEEDARRRTMRMLDTYKEVVEGVLACWLMKDKTPSQNVSAGAVDTLPNRSDDERR